MTADEASSIYRDLMRFKPSELSPNGWAVKAGVSRTVWADMRRHGNPSRRTLERLLAVIGSSLAEFEALRLGDEPARPVQTGRSFAERASGLWGPAHPMPLPLLATSLAGEWAEPDSGIELTELRTDQVIDRVPRPPSLAGDSEAYAITIVGDAMWPRFRPGRHVAVSPRSPVSVGDDVIVRLASGRGDALPVLIKQLVKRNSKSIELRQFNPDVSFCVELTEVEAVHKIAGELI